MLCKGTCITASNNDQYMFMCSALTEEVMENDDLTEQEVPHDTGASEKSLWVDKYSPRSYMELLSDDVSQGFIFSTHLIISQLVNKICLQHTCSKLVNKL